MSHSKKISLDNRGKKSNSIIELDNSSDNSQEDFTEAIKIINAQCDFYNSQQKVSNFKIKYK
jgi:hypothetical protein